MVTGPDGKTKVADYWEPCKKSILTAALLESMVEEIVPVLALEDYSEAKLMNASKAAFGISKWCRAIIGYHGAMKVVVPKKIELAAAKESSAAAQKLYDAAKEKLAGVQAEMKKLVDELEST